MLNCIFLTIFAILPNPDIKIANVDEVRLNHVYDEYGQRILSQIIYLDFDDNESRLYRGWKKIRLENPITEEQRQNRIKIDDAFKHFKSVKPEWLENINPSLNSLDIIPYEGSRAILILHENQYYLLKFKILIELHTSWDEELLMRTEETVRKVLWE